MDDDVRLILDHVEPIREDDDNGGFRIAITARFESIRTPLKVDITTGDQITPEPIRYTFQSNFMNKRIEVWAYNIETILAEKVETILRRGVLNTRLRDYYDVYLIMNTNHDKIDLAVFRSALIATSRYRWSLAAIENMDEIIQVIYSDQIMRERWDRYCKEYAYAKAIDFDAVIITLRGILSI